MAFEEFFLYDNYTDAFQVGYNPLYDFVSPLYWIPSNCEKSSSFVLPKVPAPIIAVVGQGNPVHNATIDYLKELWKW